MRSQDQEPTDAQWEAVVAPEEPRHIACGGPGCYRMVDRARPHIAFTRQVERLLPDGTIEARDGAVMAVMHEECAPSTPKGFRHLRWDIP